MTELPVFEPEKRKVFLDQGIDLHFYDLNSSGKSTILLLHGLGVCAESWGFQLVPLIETDFRVIAPDLRGFGKTSYPGGANNVKIMANDMVYLLDHLQLGSCHVMGISMGGAVSLQLALDNPGRVDSLILVNTFAKLRPHRISSWFFYSVRFLLAHILGIQPQAQFVSKKLFPDPDQLPYRDIFYEQISQANPRAYRSMMRSFITFDLSGRLKDLNIPVLVITGSRDAIVPQETQEELSKAIPMVDHEVIQDAGHAVTVEKPDEFNRIMHNFLLQYI
jgi:3-oxoadipate enol-lactonase